eukprot:scaffold12.g8294.t1
MQLQGAVSLVLSLLWSVYRTYLSGLVGLVVPPHTRDAALQLFCDCRANVPAMTSAVAYFLAGLMGLCTLSLGLSVAGIYAALAFLTIAGVVLSSFLGLVGLCLLVSACVTGVLATGTLFSYVGVSTALGAARLVVNAVFGPPTPPPAPRQPAVLDETGREAYPHSPHSAHSAPHLRSPPPQVQPAPQAAPPPLELQQLTLPPIRTKSPRAQHCAGSQGSPFSSGAARRSPPPPEQQQQANGSSSAPLAGQPDSGATSGGVATPTFSSEAALGTAVGGHVLSPGGSIEGTAPVAEGATSPPPAANPTNHSPNSNGNGSGNGKRGSKHGARIAPSSQAMHIHADASREHTRAPQTPPHAGSAIPLAVA